MRDLKACIQSSPLPGSVNGKYKLTGFEICHAMQVISGDQLM